MLVGEPKQARRAIDGLRMIDIKKSGVLVN